MVSGGVVVLSIDSGMYIESQYLTALLSMVLSMRPEQGKTWNVIYHHVSLLQQQISAGR